MKCLWSQINTIKRKKLIKAAAFFESHFMHYGAAEDRWTIPSSLLLAATTVIPVGKNDEFLTRISLFKFLFFF